jgi:hypothetical protein
VSLADGDLLKQGKPPDADFQGGEVGRLTHDRAPDDAGLTSCSCALSLPRCSSDGRCGREEREGRNPFSPQPSATRQRRRAGGPPQRSCMWCACPLPCHHGKAYRFVWVPEKIRKTIPVLTLWVHYANRLSCNKCPDEHRAASRDERWPNTGLRSSSCVLDRREEERPPDMREATITIAITHSALPPVV